MINLDFWNKENISLFIAVAGLSLSIYSVIRQAYFSRAKLRITYRSHYCSETTSFNLIIENCSRLDISISKMALVINSRECDFLYSPKTVWATEIKSGGEVKSRKEIDSIIFPQTISGLGSIGGYFAIVLDSKTNKILGKPCEIVIKVFSNRGIFSFPIKTNYPKVDDVY
jgi:hypothetical protein